MRELYCKKCGKKINTKLWMVPNSCVCGVNLDEWKKNIVEELLFVICYAYFY